MHFQKWEKLRFNRIDNLIALGGKVIVLALIFPVVSHFL